MIIYITALLSLTVAYFIQKIFFFDHENISTETPPKFSYFGRLLNGEFNMKKNGPIKLIKTGREELGNIFRIRVFNKYITFLIGPEHSEIFFNATSTELSPREVNRFMIPVFGKGVAYDVTPEVMSQQIRWVVNGLTTNFLQVYCQKIYEETTNYFKNQPDEGKCNIFEKMCELSTFSAARCLLGDEIRENITEEFGPLYDDLSNGLTQISIFAPYFPCKAHRKRDEARKKISNLFEKIIAKRRKTGERPKDFLQTLMESEYRDGKKITEDEIIGLLISLLFAGQHNAAITTTQAIMYLAKYKSKYIDCFLEEQQKILGKSGNKNFTLENVENMTFLHNQIKETLRMFPPLILLFRYALVDLKTKGYKISKGDIVCVSPAVTNRLKKQYKNPDDFDPNRYDLREEGEGFSFQTFGGGRHKCVGQRFGYLQIEIFFSVFLQMFDWKLVDSTQEPQIDFSSFFCKPVDNTYIKFCRKSNLNN